LNKKIQIIFFLIFILYSINPSYSAISEKNYLGKIKSSLKAGEQKKVCTLSSAFFRNYPRSRYIPDVRFMLAENEDDPDSAILRYKTIVNKYRYYKKRDLAQYRICLLYTSPIPRDVEESRMPSSA